MKKQDKLFSLLKRHGWEQKSAPSDVGYQFIIERINKENASYVGFEALGWCEALGITSHNIFMQKEGDHYVTYLEF